MKILNLIPDNNYGGIQQVAKLINSFCAEERYHSSNISLADFFKGAPESWINKWIFVFFNLRKTLKLSDPDLVIVHNPIAALMVPLFLLKKSIYVIHGPLRVPGKKILNNWFLITINTIFFFLYARTVTVSKGISFELPNFKKNKNRVIYNAPADIFYLENTNQFVFEYLKKYKGIKLVHFGRFCYQKNQEFSIRLLNEFRKRNELSQLVLIGSGEDTNNLIALCQKFGLKVCMLDEPPSEKYDVVLFPPQSGLSWISEYFDVAIFPSRYEGFPLAILECLSIGMPVVSSDCKHGPREILNICKKNNNKFKSLKVISGNFESEFCIEEWCDAITSLSKHSNHFSDEEISVDHSRAEMKKNWVSLIKEFDNNSKNQYARN